MNRTYSIDICVNASSRVRGPEVFWMSRWDDWVDMVYPIFVLRSEQNTVLINTGLPEDIEALGDHWEAYMGGPQGRPVRQPGQDIASHLKRLGIAPGDVDTLILTPLQSYNLGSVQAFPRARICINRTGWAAFHAPRFETSHAARASTIPDQTLNYLSTEAWDRVHLTDDEEQILPGLSTTRVGGHHPESGILWVETERGTVAITDTAFNYENIESDIPLGIAENLEEIAHAYDILRKSDAIMLPAYDPARLQAFEDETI